MKGIYRLAAIPLVVALTACADGSSTQNATGADPTGNCDGNCANTALTVDDIQTIIAQSVNEAQSLSVNATIAVADRVGNVLAVYRMGDAASRSVLVTTEQDRDLNNDGIIDQNQSGTPAVNSGLEGIQLPATAGPLENSNLDHFAAIAKAVTGAYLSSQGNAFTTRTANQIVQDHFNPGEDFQPAGPLFGVQFSQLACSDFIQPANVPTPALSIGPRSSPLGLSADPGGFPLYKNGDVVGGIGVMADSIYGVDTVISNSDNNIDELVALAGTFGFGAPIDRRERITVEGKIFRYSDVDYQNLNSDPTSAPAFDSLGGAGQLITVNGYTGAAIRAGTTFGSPQSGITADNGQTFDPSLDAFVFVDASNQPRFLPQTASDVGGDSLTAAEVTEILEQALGVANIARAQIRRPLSTPARVTISVVDTQGNILGMIRGRDAPVFGADVSLQKARTAAFFSSPSAGSYLEGVPSAAYARPTDLAQLNPDDFLVVDIGSYLTQLRDFIGDPNALSPNGTAFAFSDRAGGNLSRPFYPDGINGNPAGPLSKPAGQWSVFSSGLQLDLSYNAILAHAALFSGTDNSPRGCAGQLGVDEIARTALLNLPRTRPAEQAVTDLRLANGLQIFPGSVPIYRGSTLIGGIGVSGDGVDQDDMIAFLGLARAGDVVNVNNAPLELRADNLQPQGVRLRYIQCPQAPFLNSTTEGVCDGI